MSAIRQTIGEKEVSAKTAITVVAAAFALIWLTDTLLMFLSRMGVSPLVTSTVFWAVGGALAVFVYYRYVIRYMYTVDGVKLVVDRQYNRKPRFMLQVLLREIVFVGPADEARAKFAGAKAKKAIRKTNAITPVAVVYKRSGETHILILQPNEEIRQAFMEAVKK